MKRYLVFAWPDYEGSGGFNDLQGMADTEEEAHKIVNNLSKVMSENVDIIDTRDAEFMKRYDLPQHSHI